jgi:triosephosphate isomerase (TIM)
MRPYVHALLVWVASLMASNVGAFMPPTKSASTLETSLFARKPFITGNWKLNPQTKEEAIQLATAIASSVTNDSPGDIGLFVPFPFIEMVQRIAGDKFHVGAEV